MQNKLLGIIIAVVLVVVIGGWVYHEKKVSVSPPPQVPANPDTSTSGITMAQMATHNSKTNCWAVINSFVYDLTSWIPNHPGGEEAILQLCGTDGTAKFDSKHGGDSRAKGVLAGFKIGTLAQ